MEDKSHSSRSPEASGRAVQPLQTVLQASESEPNSLFFGFAYTLLFILGGVVLLGGVYGVFDAAMMDPTVPTNWQTGLANTERVYNQGLMHRREIKLLGSGIAVVAGILAVGFGIVGHIGIRLLSEFQEIRDGRDGS
jgi:hypothetical protein